MRERPILFSAPMVRAILAGAKTQTRRVFNGSLHDVSMWIANTTNNPNVTVRCPYGQPGDRLWVREAWKAHTTFDHLPPRDIPESHVWYMADDGYKAESRHRQGMFMPRWAGRITLEVTGVRVERLQDISEADAIAEGIERGEGFPGWYRGPLPGDSAGLEQAGREFKIPTAFARLAYRALWESINGPGSWDANPWVWVVGFRRMTPTNSADPHGGQ